MKKSLQMNRLLLKKTFKIISITKIIIFYFNCLFDPFSYFYIVVVNQFVPIIFIRTQSRFVSLFLAIKILNLVKVFCVTIIG